jgi:hypothetical protein
MANQEPLVRSFEVEMSERLFYNSFSLKAILDRLENQDLLESLEKKVGSTRIEDKNLTFKFKVFLEFRDQLEKLGHLVLRV